MRVFLVYPLVPKNRRHEDTVKSYWAPLGLAYVASSLEKGGHVVEIFDRDVYLRKYGPDRLEPMMREHIQEFRPDIIGFSATTPLMLDVFEVAAAIKKYWPDALYAVGGTHATALPERTLDECPELDVVCRGEGEFIMADLAAKLPFEDIEGITYRADGRIVSNPDRPAVQDIDVIPIPARHLLDMDFYTRPGPNLIRYEVLRSASIFTARGCPFRCTFCAGHHVFGKKVRFHSPEYVLREVMGIIGKYHVEGLYFADDMFLSNKKRALRICELFIENGIDREIKWAVQVKVNSVDGEVLKAMKRAGCIQVEYGFESGSQKVLDSLNKGTKVEQNYAAARLTRKAGLRCFADIIVGTIGETEEDFNATTKFLKESKPEMVGYYKLMPLPGSTMFNELLKQGTISFNWDAIANDYSGVVLSGMGKEKFDRLYKKVFDEIILPTHLTDYAGNNFLRDKPATVHLLYKLFKWMVRHPLKALTFFGTYHRLRVLPLYALAPFFLLLDRGARAVVLSYLRQRIRWFRLSVIRMSE